MLIKDVQMRIESLTINNDAELKNANELAKEINKGIKEVQAIYKEPKAEASKAHKLIVAEEKEQLKPWKEAQAVLKDAIGKYMIALEEKRKKELEVAKEAEEFFGVAVEVKEKPQLGGTHIREVWDVEIVNADKVPIKYGNHVIREINISALKDIAKFEDGQAQIDGVRFFKKKVTVIR